MRTRRPAPGIVLGLLLVRSITLRAGVLGVNVTPSSPIVNQPASVTVTKQDPCGAVPIDFGDGVSQTFAVAGLPFSTQHTWTTTRSKMATARGRPR